MRDDIQMNPYGSSQQSAPSPPPYQQFAQPSQMPQQQFAQSAPISQQQQQQQQQYGQLPPPVSPEQFREQQFRTIVNKYEISEMFASRLQKLNTFKIVFIFDDSGSMCSPLDESPLNKGLIKATRWDELKYFSEISIEIANVFNQDGTDVYFLNRPMARNVRSTSDLAPYMLAPPNGYTPIPRVLGTVLNNNGPNFLGEKKLLVMIVTDGEPTDDRGNQDIAGFRKMLDSRGPNVYTTIVSCTDEEQTMNYLNNWDRIIPRLDVVDDYRSEKEEILRAQGHGFRFTFGDYVVKSLLGSIDPSLDKLDEGCCTIL